MFNQIKYTYITQNKSTNGIINNLTSTLKELELLIDKYIVIDNITLGVKIYPNIVQDNVIRCSKEELEERVAKLIEDETDLILLNGFNISLDEIKEKYAPMVDDSYTALCINELKDVTKNISVEIDTAIKDLSEEE